MLNLNLGLVRVVVPALAVLALVSAGCEQESSSSGEGASVDAATQEPTDQGSVNPDATAPPEGEQQATPTAEAPLEVGASRDNAAPVGTALNVAGWTLVVKQILPNATELVLAENQFNDPPADGRQFFIATISATYDGDEESSTLFADVSLQALGPTNVAYRDYSDTCGVIPGELDTFVEVFRGGTIEGNVCWSILSEDAPALLMSADESFSLDSDRLWFSLAP